MPVLRMRTYLIDQETGEGGVVSDDLPWIAWIGDSSFITVPSDPYPKVEVRRAVSRVAAGCPGPVAWLADRIAAGCPEPFAEMVRRDTMTRNLTRTTEERETR